MGGRGGGGEVVGKDVSSIFSKFVWLLRLVRNFFCTENIITKKKNKKIGQVQNKPEMRLLLKNPGGTFLQIQTDIYQKQRMEIKQKMQSRLMGRCHSPSGELGTKLIPSSFNFNF